MSSFSFDQIPSNQRLPSARAEFSNNNALQGLPPAASKVLLIGQRLTPGTVPASTLRRVLTADQGVVWFGRGSQLARMIAAAFAVDPLVELWAIAIDNHGGGVAATGTITLTGPATANGTLSLMIAGTHLQVGVTAGDTATAVAAAIAAAVALKPDLPVVAAAAAGVVTFTAVNRGSVGNDIDIRQNHYDGEVIPAGLTSTIIGMAGGATNGDIVGIVASLGDEQFQHIATGLNDATNLTLLGAELATRWGPMRQIEGHAWAGMAGSFATLASFGATRNDPHVTLVGGFRVPTPPAELATAFAVMAAQELTKDPAKPLSTVVVPGVVAPRIEHRFLDTERELLLRDGISTFTTSSSGEVAMERMITTYQTNSLALEDVSYLDVNTLATLGYYRFSWRARMRTKFPRAKLTDDIITAVRAETIALAREWEEEGLMEDVDGFIAGLIIERDTANRTQLNFKLTPDVVNGLLQFAARIEFKL
ncbi:phage tail sheath subtilisin-like domain-containing protein [Sphingobium yanoikuyae]|uniref:Phage tail protein n=1 Tax=Sphingobium yanoikuyae TaxID=13690 RepID=A0A430BX13_SPHYA|nr:phage tail sheath subtilisin-like domain-containing protein [Sphingobium yanoikuyae]RSU57193.1 phage tail protein [Sphingobium yanoikuyae]